MDLVLDFFALDPFGLVFVEIATRLIRSLSLISRLISQLSRGPTQKFALFPFLTEHENLQFSGIDVFKISKLRLGRESALSWPKVLVQMSH